MNRSYLSWARSIVAFKLARQLRVCVPHVLINWPINKLLTLAWLRCYPPIKLNYLGSKMIHVYT